MGHFPAGGGALPKPGLGRYWWACWEVAWRFHKGLMGMQGLSCPSQTCSHICRLAFWWFSKLSFEGTFRLLKKKCRYILLWWILQSECFPDIQCGCFRFSMETVCPTLAWHVTWGKAIWFMVSAYKGWGKKKVKSGPWVFLLYMCWMPYPGMRQGKATVWSFCVLVGMCYAKKHLM